MQARSFQIDGMADLALRHLEGNASALAERVATHLRAAPPVQNAKPRLIALDAIELGRVVDFQWSPYYAGTNIHSAVTADPIVEGGHCHELLAETIRRHMQRRRSACAVFPAALELRSRMNRNFSSRFAFCDQSVFYVLPYIEDKAAWFVSFDDALRAASNPAGMDVGFCTSVEPPGGLDWTAQDLDDMIDAASWVFASALDGDGYLVWEV